LLEDFLNRKRYESAAAQFGNYFHTGAAAWWNSDRGNDGYHEMLAAAAAEYDMSEDTAGYHTRGLLKTMLEKYSQKADIAAGVPGDWQVVDIERRVFAEIALGDPDAPEMSFIMGFKLDRVLRQDDRLLIVDIKTSANPDKRWADRLRRSIQLRIYAMLAAQEYGVDNVDVMVEGVAKRKSPGQLRVEHVSLGWTQDYLDEALGLAMQVATADEMAMTAAYASIEATADTPADELDAALAEWALTQGFFNYGHCYSYGFECPFMDLCDASPGDRLELLAKHYYQGEPWSEAD
jgi:hypothetical protein